MHRRHLLGLAAASLLTLSGCSYLGMGSSSTPSAPAPMPAPNLTGTWVPRQAELGGRDYALGNFRNAMLTVSAQGDYEFGTDKGRITLLPGQLPPYKMDIQGKQGPNAGRTILAAYAMENEELIVCYQLARDGERPGSLISPDGSAVLLVRYRRLAPAVG